MKQLSIIAILLLAQSFSSKAQTAKNDTYCDVVVTAICYDPNNPPPGYPTNCGTVTYGNSVTVSLLSSTGAPTCPNPTDRVIGYEVCWVTSLCPPGICTQVDLFGGTAAHPFSACAGAWSSPPWSFYNVNPAVLPQCSDCVQPHGGAAIVKADPSTGDVYIVP